MEGYLMREDFQRFWHFRYIGRAEKFLDSKLEPKKKVAKTLRNHKGLILNWFRAEGKVSNGPVEGLDLKVKLAMRKTYVFRNVEIIQIALYHKLGNLPEPKICNKFY
jgi:transposase